jgi:hypothetical protein
MGRFRGENSSDWTTRSPLAACFCGACERFSSSPPVPEICSNTRRSRVAKAWLESPHSGRAFVLLYSSRWARAGWSSPVLRVGRRAHPRRTHGVAPDATGRRPGHSRRQGGADDVEDPAGVWGVSSGAIGNLAVHRTGRPGNAGTGRGRGPQTVPASRGDGGWLGAVAWMTPPESRVSSGVEGDATCRLAGCPGNRDPADVHPITCVFLSDGLTTPRGPRASARAAERSACPRQQRPGRDRVRLDGARRSTRTTRRH